MQWFLSTQPLNQMFYSALFNWARMNLEKADISISNSILSMKNTMQSPLIQFIVMVGERVQWERMMVGMCVPVQCMDKWP